MNQEELIALSEKNIVGTYRRQPVVFVRGEGARLWDIEGKEYLDFVAGIAVCSLGHSHPKVVEAICRQAGALMHVSNLYYTEPQIRLASMLTEHSFADRVFFCNSGAEANEAAIKLARKYGHDRLGGRYEILTMKGSFHGRTLAAITATGQEKFHAGFAPLPEGFRYVPFNDVQALEKALSEKTCAVLLEPIQGEGGVRVPDEGYLKAVRGICDRRGILMILDEVQTGMGRTGKLFGYEHYGASPDIMTLAKALGTAFPRGRSRRRRGSPPPSARGLTPRPSVETRWPWPRPWRPWRRSCRRASWSAAPRRASTSGRSCGRSGRIIPSSRTCAARACSSGWISASTVMPS